MRPTEKEFRESSAWREELAQVLQNPTLQIALDVIRSNPSEFPAAIPGVHYDLILSREHSKTVGINHAIKKLHDLTRAQATIENIDDSAERQQWGDNLPKEMADAIKKFRETQK